MNNRLTAEFIGTLWLVLGGCGTAVLAGSAVGVLGVALAFGLTIITIAYAIGPVSGCHLNPAVTVGMWMGGRFSSKDVIPYIVAQVLGSIAGAGILYLVATGKAGFDVSLGFASNGYGEHSPAGFSMRAAMISEVVLTFMFVLVILGSTDARVPAGFAPLAIGLALTLVHLISIPVTNTSVNPARSTGVAMFAGGWAMQQLWLFWVAPMLGAVVAGVFYKGSQK